MNKFFFLILFFLMVGGLFLTASFLIESKTVEFLSEETLGAVSVLPIQIEKPKFLPFQLEKFKENLILKNADFIAVDLEKMKAGIYEEGKMVSEFPVLAKGNPSAWAGVPVGMYQVIAKHKIAFSNISRVYMPYSIKFYGKYYLHGQPYFPGGRLFQGAVSGGCIRFLNKYAKLLYDFAEDGMPILITDAGFKSDGYDYSLPSSLSAFPGVSSKSLLAADLENGFVFLAKNSENVLSIASLTKLMTALVVVEQIDLRRSILVSQKMIAPLESFNWFRPKLKIGKRYRPVELFYPLMISSSNDAAEVLSYFSGKEKTIELMNKKALSLGMGKTEFSDPTGLGKEFSKISSSISPGENLSTARDIFYLARYILNVQPLLLKITKGEGVRTFGGVAYKNLANKNIFFKEPNFIGGKTGYTQEAGHTGLFLFNFFTREKQNRKVAIVLLGSKDLKGDVEIILNWLNKNYFAGSEVKAVKNDNSPPLAAISCQPTVNCGTKDCAAIRGCLFHLLNNSSDPDGKNDIASSEWDILNWGASPDLSCKANPFCNFTPQTFILPPGEYRIELRVTDRMGLQNKTEINFLLKK